MTATATAAKFDWIKGRWAFFAFSGLLTAGSLAAIAVRGFNYSIEFTGGTLIQVTYPQEKTLEQVRKDLAAAGWNEAEPQSFSGSNSFAIRVKSETGLDDAATDSLIAGLSKDPANAPRVDAREYVGPTVGRHLKRRAMVAIALALAAIVLYVAIRFENPLWGAAGVVALFHDVLATAGLFAVMQKEIDLVIVAALLTIAGYSINDTIVIFDRMRERAKLYRRETIGERINNSVNEMLGRTIITNGCVIAAVVAILSFGGPVLRDFALAMLFGGVIGTYSTVAIATPLVYQWESGHRR